jgi:hypothetical protein
MMWWWYPSFAWMQADRTYHLKQLECKLELQDMTADWIMIRLDNVFPYFPWLKHMPSHGTLKIWVVFHDGFGSNASATWQSTGLVAAVTHLGYIHVFLEKNIEKYLSLWLGYYMDMHDIHGYTRYTWIHNHV